MRLLCLDLATVTGVVKGVVGSTPYGWAVRLRDADDPHRLASRRLALLISQECRHFKPDLVVYEAPISLQAAHKIARHIQAGTVELLHGLAHCVEGVAACYGIDSVGVRPQTARKALGLNTRGKTGPEQKKMVRDVCRRLGWWEESWDLNVCDAAALFFWASNEFGGRGAHQLPGPLFDGGL